VANDNKAYAVAPGGMIQRVSTPPVETAISQGQPLAAFYYQDEGHEFAAIVFQNRPAWVFDMTGGEWHERAEGANGAWDAVRAGRAYGNFYVGNNFGQVSRLARVNHDNGQPLVRRMVSKTLFTEGRFKVPSLSFRLRTGFTGTAMLRTSRDRGFTWSAPKDRSAGNAGQYELQMTWRNLGLFRNMTAELSITDPVELPVESLADVVIR